MAWSRSVFALSIVICQRQVQLIPQFAPEKPSNVVTERVVRIAPNVLIEVGNGILDRDDFCRKDVALRADTVEPEQGPLDPLDAVKTTLSLGVARTASQLESVRPLDNPLTDPASRRLLGRKCGRRSEDRQDQEPRREDRHSIKTHGSGLPRPFNPPESEAWARDHTTRFQDRGSV
jgi:hypothetical protein